MCLYLWSAGLSPASLENNLLRYSSLVPLGTQVPLPLVEICVETVFEKFPRQFGQVTYGYTHSAFVIGVGVTICLLSSWQHLQISALLFQQTRLLFSFWDAESLGSMILRGCFPCPQCWDPWSHDTWLLPLPSDSTHTTPFPFSSSQRMCPSCYSPPTVSPHIHFTVVVGFASHPSSRKHSQTGILVGTLLLRYTEPGIYQTLGE